MRTSYAGRFSAISILYWLIPLGLALMAVAVWGFMWAVRSGQFDDLDGPAHRILMDDDDPRIPHRERDAVQAAERSALQDTGRDEDKPR